MPAVHHHRHRCSHSPVLDTCTVTVTGILIVALAIVDHWHRSSFISLFSHLIVMLSAGALVPTSCLVPFVQLIVMFFAGASSSTSHHAPCPLTSPLHLPLVCQLVDASPLLLCHCLLLFSQRAASASALQCAAASCPPFLGCLLFASCLSCCISWRGLHLASPFIVSPPHVPILDLPPSFSPADCCVASCCTASASHPLVNTAAS